MIDSLLGGHVIVNLTNDPLGVVRIRNSVESILAKDCWVPQLSCNTFASENVIAWNEILVFHYNRFTKK